MSREHQHGWQLWGWILFIVSALFFIATSLRAGDPLGLLGGVFFLVACFVFLVPLAAEAGWLSNLSRLRRYSRYPRDWFRAARCLSPAPGAPMTVPVPEHLRDQSRRLQVRSALRYYASTR